MKQNFVDIKTKVISEENIWSSSSVLILCLRIRLKLD